MKNLFFVITLLFSVALITSCQKEEIEDPVIPDAPELPALEMFTMPTDQYDPELVDTSGLIQTNDRGVTDTYFNWFHAAVNLVVWNAVVAINTAAPIAAFGAAFNVEPVYIGDLTFEWAYEYVAPVELGGHTYNVALTGQWDPAIENVDWVMTLSQVGGYTDFVWYTGTTNAGNTDGAFTLNHQPFNPQNYLQLDYQRDPGSEAAILRFTNIIPGNMNFGDYIEYQEAPGNALDRGFTVALETYQYLRYSVE